MKHLSLLIVFTAMFGIGLKSQKAKDYYKTAQDFIEAQRFEDAIAQYSKAVELEPDYVDAYIERAQMYKRLGDYKSAVDDYERAITFDDNEEEFYYWAAEAHYQLGNYDKALVHVKKCIEEKSRYLEAYILQTKIHVEQNDYNKALDAANEAVDLRKNEQTLYQRGLVYELLDKTIEAQADFDDAISKYNDYLPAHIAMSRINLKMDNTTKALHHADKAVELGPKSTAAFEARSAVNAENLQYAAAIDDISKNILLDKNNDKWYMVRGQYYMDFAQYMNAINDFTKAINIDKKNANAYYKRAYAYEQIQNFEKAISDYEKLTALSEYDAKARKLLDQANKRLFELNRETNSPEILVENTTPNSNSNINVPKNKEELTLRGNIKDESELKTLTINDREIQFIKKDDHYEFVDDVDIDDTNMVSITAIDVYDNVQNLTVNLIRTEIDAPEVAILAPIASDNGEIYLDHDSPSLYVEGKIKDESAITSILVNGVSASYRMDEVNPKFSANIDIMNKNKFTVKVVDRYGNEKVKDFYLNREAIALSENNPMGKTWVVFIENSNYSSFASLEGPGKDVSLMRGSLAGYKIHNIIHKKDMTKKEMERFFSIELRDLVKSNQVNSLMVWYAGHGKFINETGYWIPVDAKRDDEFTYFNINALRASMQAYSNQITHTLVITDACESGPTFYQAMRSEMKERSCNDWEATKFKSAQVFSSAGYELAVDNSQFTRTFSNVLDNNPNSCIPIENIVEKVSTAVAKNNQQKPKFGKIAGLEDENGTFFFMSKD
ncbi:MAG: tetratricopeptide repeat protein [Bacteroidetes bacterium]|jgi:tetratricopeptide (TPR) repeat protein|nr:tetratricopeptide repeat protein [Bacteroidota bacterium]